jgi:DDE family transposase
VVVDSRSLRSAPTAWMRGIDGGKLVKGVKLFAICDKHGSLLDLELQPANVDDRADSLPTLPRLAALGFQGDLLGDSGFKGAPFAAAALDHDIHVSVSPGGTRDGRFLPRGIRWVVLPRTILPDSASSGRRWSLASLCPGPSGTRAPWPS